MFNECHIHLCDYTWLNVFHILNFCWSNTKRFLSVLIFFGKSFVFAKISKFSKTVLPYLATWSRVNPIACPQLTQKFFATHWRVKVLVTKKVRNFFQNFGFLKFSQLGLATCLWGEAPVARLYRSFRGSLRDLLAGVPSSHKKHLENFSKILSLRCLVAWLGDLFATWFSHEKCVFCVLRTIFKTFQFSLKHF